MLFIISFSIFVIGIWLTLNSIDHSVEEKLGVVFTIAGMSFLFMSMIFSVTGV